MERIRKPRNSWRNGLPPAFIEELEARRYLSSISIAAPTTLLVPGSNLYGEIAADFGNGHNDVAAIYNTDATTLGHVAILMNDGHGNFTPGQTLTTGHAPQWIEAGDLKGRGIQDLMVSNTQDGTLDIFFGNGDGTFNPTPQVLTFGNTGGAAADEFFLVKSGNTVTGMVLDDPRDQTAFTYANNNGSFTKLETFDQSFGSAFTVVDLAGNGSPDIVYDSPAGQTAGSVIGQYMDILTGGIAAYPIHLFQPTNFVNASLPAHYDSAGGLVAGKFGVGSAPGVVDQIIPSIGFSGSDFSNGFIQAGSGLGAPKETTAGGFNVAAGDFDADGKDDVLVFGTGTADVMLSNGDGSFAPQNLNFTVGAQGPQVAIADFNGDGKADLVMASQGGAALGYYANSGSGGGGGGGTASGLTGTVAGTLPASVIAGQKTKITQSLTLTNPTAASIAGTVSGTLYLSENGTVDANSVRLVSSSKKVKLKPGGRVTFRFKPSSIPVGTPSGAYHVVAQFTGPSGGTADALSSGTITIAPPQIDLSGAFSKQPVPGKGGKTALTFSVSNAGNTAAVGALEFGIDTSPDGKLPDATQVTTGTKKVNLKPAKSVKIAFTATLPTGSYFVLIRLDPGDVFHDVNLANNLIVSSGTIIVG